MTIRKLFITIYSVMIIMLLVLMGVVLYLMNTLTQVYASQEARYESYLLADELRQSSDDLTRFARTYAVSADSKYEEMYWDVLAIRNGEKPRPSNYERIYWDFVASDGQKPRADDERVPLRTLMEQRGFTQQELAKLQEAQNNSDALVWTETIVMNAVKGLYDDGTGKFTVKGESDLEMARRLMHDQAYHEEKAKIMGPIDEFFKMIDERTNTTVQGYIQRGNIILGVVVALIGTMIILSIGSFVTIQSRVSRPVAAMSEAAAKVAQGDVTQEITLERRDDIGQLAEAFRRIIAYQRNMAGAANRLAQGDLSVNVTPQSEEDVLSNAFIQMIAYQQQMAGAANHLAQGDVTVDVAPQSKEDVLGNAFTQMIAYQQQMAGAANRLAQGDLTTDVALESEQDALGNAFSRMIANLRNLIGQTQQSAGQVAQASQQLNAAAEQAGRASQQVATTTQQVAQGTSQQTQAVAEATNNAEQMARAAEGIARGAQEQAHGVQKTSTLIDDMTDIVDQVGQVAGSVTEANAKVTQAARHGVTAVEQTGQGMETIRTRTAVAVEKVKEMSNRSKEIGRIVETIDDIADKTDMLALNAAVEAARAGEHGRGFAVVADQVRKLSEDSKVATRDIDKLIERVQEAINEAIIAMENTVTEVDNGTRLAGDTTQSLQDILQAAEESVVMAEQINQAVDQLKEKSKGVEAAVEAVSAVVEENTAVAEQMAANSQEVTDAMEGVVSVAEENNAATEEVSASAEEMSAQVEEVVASAEELSTLAEGLRAAVAQFRVAENGRTGQRWSEDSPETVGVPANGRQSQVAPVPAGHQGDGYSGDQ